ncbi:hypothetical protein B0H11DRAFT_1909219 [Mycena galericulata]|nr:hypothetical protein B0H11DRAFT_1909219 [Mycena galericulata]
MKVRELVFLAFKRRLLGRSRSDGYQQVAEIGRLGILKKLLKEGLALLWRASVGSAFQVTPLEFPQVTPYEVPPLECPRYISRKITSDELPARCRHIPPLFSGIHCRRPVLNSGSCILIFFDAPPNVVSEPHPVPVFNIIHRGSVAMARGLTMLFKLYKNSRACEMIFARSDCPKSCARKVYDARAELMISLNGAVLDVFARAVKEVREFRGYPIWESAIGSGTGCPFWPAKRPFNPVPALRS